MATIYMCKACGMLHEDPEAVCCGERVGTLDEAFERQGRLFELTGNEKAQNVLDSLKAVYTDANTAVARARRRYNDAVRARELAAEALTDFYALTVAEEPQPAEDDEF